MIKTYGAADDRHTFNPNLFFDVVHGGFESEFLRNRTLSFTLTDNAKGYDEFSWSLDNRDGALTDVTKIALGLLLRVRLGYTDDTQNWRTFIVSRMQGGVGVANSEGDGGPAVGSGHDTIVYTGRNRNAPDLKARKSRKKGSSTASKSAKIPKPTGRGTGHYSKRFKGKGSPGIMRYDSAQRDAWHGPTEGGDTRIFSVRHLSDAVKEIAYRNGYVQNKVFVQDTEDEVSHIVIPTGIADAQFLEMQADMLGWVFKMNPNTFHFHEERWKLGMRARSHTFTYGGPDILDLSVDFDFNLPVPGVVRTKSQNTLVRLLLDTSVTEEDSPVEHKIGIAFFDADTKASRKKYLKRDSTYCVPGGVKKQASLAAQNSMVNRHIRAMKLNLTLIGNPDVVGGDEINLKGTNCRLVDGKWYAEVVRQVFSGTTYVTEIDLRLPPKARGKGKVTTRRGELRDMDSIGKGLTKNYGHTYYSSTDARARRLSARAGSPGPNAPSNPKSPYMP
jgi:hypothetical protein